MKQQADNDHVDELVGKVVEEYLQCCERGEQPQLDEFVERHPEVGDILQTVIPALHATEHMTGVFGDGTTHLRDNWVTFASCGKSVAAVWASFTRRNRSP